MDRGCPMAGLGGYRFNAGLPSQKAAAHMAAICARTYEGAAPDVARDRHGDTARTLRWSVHRLHAYAALDPSRGDRAVHGYPSENATFLGLQSLLLADITSGVAGHDQLQGEQMNTVIAGLKVRYISSWFLNTITRSGARQRGRIGSSPALCDLILRIGLLLAGVFAVSAQAQTLVVWGF